MKKLKEEFKKWYKEYYQRDINIPDDFLEDDSFLFVGWKACWESRDPEIEELKDELEEREKQKTIMRNIINLKNKKVKKLKEDFDKRKEEIKKLRDALKICMSALQRETRHIPNYDITESQMWVMFKEALGETDG